MRHLLDTNLISNVIKAEPSDIASLTFAEIQRGILEQPASRKRNAREAWNPGPDGPPALFAGRVLAFDESARRIWAGFMAEGKKKGWPHRALDTIIAAVAEANGCLVVTDNEPTTKRTSCESRCSIPCGRHPEATTATCTWCISPVSPQKLTTIAAPST